MKKIKVKYFIYAQIFLVLYMGFFISEFYVNSSIKYITDIITIILFLCTIPLYLKKIKNIENKKALISIGVFTVYCILNMIIGAAGILLQVWALRVTFRFYIFFLSCIVLLDTDDFKKIFKFLEITYLINFVIVLYQFIIHKYSQDYLGGIFGTEMGCNGALNLFVVIILTYQIYNYFLKKISLKKLIMYVMIALIIAALAELKFIYIEVLVLIIFSIIKNKPSGRTLFFIITFIIAFIVGLNLLKQYFPTAYELLFDIDTLNDYLSASWTSSLQVTRNNGIQTINENFFNNAIGKKLFGLGLGNCENSSFFSSDFAIKYLDTNYRQFTFAMQYLETGVVGLVLYVWIFIVMYIDARKNNSSNFYFLLLVMTMMNIWYNDACKVEISYILYFVYSSIYIKEKNKEEKRNEGRINYGSSSNI